MSKYKIIKINIITFLGVIMISLFTNMTVYANNADKNESITISHTNLSNNHEFIASKDTILGIKKSEWILNLNGFNKYSFESNILENIITNENDLKNKRDSEYFNKLNSNDDYKNKEKMNPLLQLKHRKAKSKYITDLDLEQTDFIKTINLIPLMKLNYNDDEIAKFIPYIALCLNNNMEISEVEYYIKIDVKKSIPIDIATQRLYNLVN